MSLTPDQKRRYGRQIRLADVGEAGQAKLCAAKVGLMTQGEARDIEECYLRLAGVGITEDVQAETSPALDFRHPVARAIGGGAFAALASIRKILLG